MIQTALLMCDLNKMFLFQALPDYFPQGRLTEVEASLWERYFEQKEQRRSR